MTGVDHISDDWAIRDGHQFDHISDDLAIRHDHQFDHISDDLAIRDGHYGPQSVSAMTASE